VTATIHFWHPTGVQVQVMQRHVVRRHACQAMNLLGELGGDPTHRRAAQRGLQAEPLGQRRLHIPGPQAADDPGDDQRLQRTLVRVTRARSTCEANRCAVSRTYGRPRPRTAGDLYGDGLVTVVRYPPNPRRVALVALAAEEHSGLRAHRGTYARPPFPPSLRRDLDACQTQVCESSRKYAALVLGFFLLFLSLGRRSPPNIAQAQRPAYLPC
jgi:hypothetical protein